MELIAEILTGRLFYVDVGEEAMVSDLKKEIGNQENLPSERLILMLDSDQSSLLEDEGVSLKEYGVQDGSHIYLFFKPLENGFSHSPITCQDSSPDTPSHVIHIPKETPEVPSPSVNPDKQNECCNAQG